MKLQSIFRSQKAISSGLLVIWLGCLVLLLLLSNPLQTPYWIGPQHFTSIFLFTLMIAVALISWRPTINNISWHALIIACLLVIGLELLQLINPARAFQFQDIVDGFAGAAAGSIASFILLTVFGQRILLILAIVMSFLVLGLTSTLWYQQVKHYAETIPQADGECSIDFKQLVISKSGVAEHQNSQTLPLCVFSAEVLQYKNGLLFQGGGVRSGQITGLAEAIRKSGQFTFGVKFKVLDRETGNGPREIVSISSGDNPNRYLANIFHFGNRATAIVRVGPVLTRSTMANRVKDNFHEIIIAHDGKIQNIWFDGNLAITDYTALDFSKLEHDDLSIVMGLRQDPRWQPFHGSIEGLYISDSALSAEEVKLVF